MVAAYVGYTIGGLAGAVVGAAAVFLPSFVLMLVLLPVFDRLRTLGWAWAAMRGISPAVIGVLAVSLLRLAPHAVPDPFAIVMLAVTVVALVYWRVASLKLMLAGSVLGVLRSRLETLPAVRSLLSAATRS
jgi:chromate transporter